MADSLKYIAWAKNLKSEILFLRKYLSERGLLTPELDKLSNQTLSLLNIEGERRQGETVEKHAQRLSAVPWQVVFEVIYSLSQPTKIKL